jgi:uncharacterized protein (DUF1501 family)
MTYYNRRQFLSRSAAGFAGVATVLGGLGNRPAFAANISGYKAMVCIMLKGGMDHNDTVLPTDQASYDALKSHRSGIFDLYGSDNPSSTRHIDNILKLNAANNASFGGRTFGLPQEMLPLHDMFESGEAAIIGNVGPLLEPVTRDDIDAGRAMLPSRLFSHNDQQSTWMALNSEGARAGWGGRFADAMIAADTVSNPLYAAITASSPDVFLAGENARPFRVPNGGSSLQIEANRNRNYLGRGADGDMAREKLAAYLSKQDLTHDNLFRKDVVESAARGIANQLDYAERLTMTTPLTTIFPSTSLGGQLESVATSIGLRAALNVKRQVFYTSIGGFDTHNNQNTSLPSLHAQIANGVAAFREAMIAEGVWNDVVVFTMSDFGRTLIGNGDGSDHGWGSHHFVAGGAVTGNQIYGGMPEIDLTSQRFTARRGRLIPTVSVEQYAATLGEWFGLESGELAQALPNLSRFSQSNLGFLNGSGA